MSFKIITKDESLPVGNLKVLIYGQPGIGKTSLANTAKNTITLDFDGGSHRAIIRNDTIQFTNWSQAVEFSNAKEDLKTYDTIVIDTVGKAVDMIISDLPIGAKTSSGQPKLQSYGIIKNTLQSWIRQLGLLGKDIIFIAHDKEDKSGEVTTIRPDITGSTLQTLIREADLIGFLRVKNKQRVLDFNPADTYIGKNCAKFDTLIIKDNYSDSLNMESIIQTAKTALESMTEAQREALEVIKTFSIAIEECGEPKHFQDVLVEIKEKVPQKALQTQLWSLLTKQASIYEIEFDKDKNYFVSLKKQEVDPPKSADKKETKETKEETDGGLVPDQKPATEF